MNSLSQIPEFSDLQRELYEATQLYFDVSTDGQGVNLSMEGVHVFSLPLNVFREPLTVRQMEFPKHLKPGPTLVQRRAILKTMSEQTMIRSRLQHILANEPGVLPQEVSQIVSLECQTRDTLCNLVWNLDDITVQRLANGLDA